jgi:hypothetical protein
MPAPTIRYPVKIPRCVRPAMPRSQQREARGDIRPRASVLSPSPGRELGGDHCDRRRGARAVRSGLGPRPCAASSAFLLVRPTGGTVFGTSRPSAVALARASVALVAATAPAVRTAAGATAPVAAPTTTPAPVRRRLRRCAAAARVATAAASARSARRRLLFLAMAYCFFLAAPSTWVCLAILRTARGVPQRKSDVAESAPTVLRGHGTAGSACVRPRALWRPATGPA